MNAPLTPDQIQTIIDKTGQPLAYIEGFAYFYGRKFTVTSDVLIPRPETEAIIDIAKSLTNQFEERRPLKILDLGTGSGCIAITLALELRNTQITATDISQSALKIARQNAKNHQTTINFQKSDLFQNLQNQKYDLITANLPYVDESWPWLNKRALSHEPAQALYAKDCGLALIKKFLEQTQQHLNPNAHILLEHDPTQLSNISSYANKHGLTAKPHTPYITILNLA